MRIVLGIIGILAGVALGIYVGVWVLFIGGILGIISAIEIFVTSGAIAHMVIGIGIAKIVCASAVGGLSAMALILPSFGLIQNKLD